MYMYMYMCMYMYIHMYVYMYMYMYMYMYSICICLCIHICCCLSQMHSPIVIDVCTFWGDPFPFDCKPANLNSKGSVSERACKD